MATKKQTTIFQELYDKAHKAGLEAGFAATPVPMVVQQRSNVLDDKSPVQQSYFVEGGVCGFAWVLVRPGNCPFANFLKTTKLGRYSAYDKGVNVWAHEFGQSMQRKEAYAQAFARVINEAGITAYSMSRID